MKNQLECSSYRFDDRNEYCLKAGNEHKDQILLIPPLFDEMNRMRRMIVDVMRILADRDIGVILPDLPGTNESLYPQDQVNFDVWRAALLACVESHPGCSYIASMRGGSLIDGISDDLPKWRLTPVKGKSLLRTLMRTRIGSDKETGISTTMAELTELAKTQPIELAGNLISPEMFVHLQEADIGNSNRLRTARLESDSQQADVKLTGDPLWLRAEPDSDDVLSQSIADDIANWIRA